MGSKLSRQGANISKLNPTCSLDQSNGDIISLKYFNPRVCVSLTSLIILQIQRCENNWHIAVVTLAQEYDLIPEAPQMLVRKHEIGIPNEYKKSPQYCAVNSAIRRSISGTALSWSSSSSFSLFDVSVIFLKLDQGSRTLLVPDAAQHLIS